MPKPWQFQLPTKIVFGPGTVRRAGELASRLGARPLVVGYRHCPALADAYGRLLASLPGATLFDGVDEDPSPQIVAQGALQAARCGADVVVALGGGSVIDAAKGIALVAAAGGQAEEYCDWHATPQPASQALPIVAIPTTAGTGSEVSSAAVLACPAHPSSGKTAVPVKGCIVADAIRPSVAIVDSQLAIGSSQELTAACGADALGHAIDAMMSRAAQPLSSLLAAKAVALVLKHLPQAVAQPDDPAPRESLALAATLAGAAFDASGVTLAHALAHALGAVLGLPHGVAVALGTRAALQYNLESARAILAELADYCEGDGSLPPDRAEYTVAYIGRLFDSLGLPTKVPRHLVERSTGLGEADDLIERLVASTMLGSPQALKLNPRRVDHAVLVGLFKSLLFKSPPGGQ